MIGVRGAGFVVVGDTDAACDPSPYLRVPKNRKYMGLQDELAVVAAGRALEDAGLATGALGERAGLFFAVGYIPFRYEDIAGVAEASAGDDGAFSMQRFVERGVPKGRPLMAFRCLPNMPVYHVSACFDVQGPYHVGYPGSGALYEALSEARLALEEGRVDLALVGGVAHQRNFLVEHHFARIDPPVPPERLADAAAVLVLARGSARAKLVDHRVRYAPDEERAETDGVELGPASLPVAVARFLRSGERRLVHEAHGRDGLVASSVWEAA